MRSKKLTVDQQRLVEKWHAWTERIANRMVPHDPEAAHDLAMEAVTSAALVAVDGGITALIRCILRRKASHRMDKRHAFSGARASVESLEWSREIVKEEIIARYDDSAEKVDTDDLIDYAAGWVGPMYVTILKAISHGEEHTSACRERGIKYEHFLWKHSRKRRKVGELIARQLGNP